MTRRTALLCSILGIVGGVFLCDRWSKTFFASRPPVAWPVPHVIETTQHFNHGFIANVPSPSIFIIGIMLSAIALVCWAMVVSITRGDAARSMALSLILAGALGNLTDRILNGYVFDWLLILNWSIVNLADIAIAAGIIWLIFTRKHPHTPSA